MCIIVNHCQKFCSFRRDPIHPGFSERVLVLHRIGFGRGGTNFILRIKEQETHLTLQEHDDDDDAKCPGVFQVIELTYF